MPRASGLFASLFEEARADQPEGHLGMELLRIRRCFDELDAGALVVLDELCSGTNPSEGRGDCGPRPLAPSRSSGVRGFVTTHLLKFADRLAHGPGASLEFLQVELDAQERPTYRFMPGVARTSLAHKTAERLGVTREELLQRIRAKRARLPTSAFRSDLSATRALAARRQAEGLRLPRSPVTNSRYSSRVVGASPSATE